MKRKLPDPKIKGDKIICPDCGKECKSKQSYNMHWFRVHTRNFNRPKKDKPEKIKVVHRKSKKETLPKWAVNFCPCCGTSLNAINMALNIVNSQ